MIFAMQSYSAIILSLPGIMLGGAIYALRMSVYNDVEIALIFKEAIDEEAEFVFGRKAIQES